jgi:hypothetical protein
VNARLVLQFSQGILKNYRASDWSRWSFGPAGILLALSVGAQAASLSLPLDRRNYVIGESVPLAVSQAAGPVKVELVDERGVTSTLYSGAVQPLVWDTTLVATGRVCLLLEPLTAKQIRFDDQTGLNASECGFAPDLDLLASFPHDLHHENDVSGRPQRACARTARKAISYPSIPS